MEEYFYRSFFIQRVFFIVADICEVNCAQLAALEATDKRIVLNCYLNQIEKFHASNPKSLVMLNHYRFQFGINK